MLFFSIIIPIYNGINNGLPKCLNSIWDQLLDESLFEVICIDDCSTDTTWDYLQQQCADHKNLTILHNQINIRQGASRNIGVKIAKGNYILFLDSDDYYHSDSLAKIYYHLQSNDLEVLVNDSTYQFGQKENNKLQLNLGYCDVTDGDSFIQKNGYACAPWRLTIKRTFLLQNNLFFVEGNRVEDIDWGLKVFYYAKRIQYFPHILVHYVKGNTGTSDNMHKDINTISDNIEAGNRTYDLSTSIYKNSKVRDIIIKTACSYYYTSTKYLLCLCDTVSNKKAIIKQIPYLPENNKLVKFAQDNPTVFCILTNCSAPLFRLFRHIHRCRIEKMYANS